MACDKGAAAPQGPEAGAGHVQLRHEMQIVNSCWSSSPRAGAASPSLRDFTSAWESFQGVGCGSAGFYRAVMQGPCAEILLHVLCRRSDSML